MISLNDDLWKGLQGGYKTIYDVSILLRRLEVTTEKREIEKILDELWNELHHQGDVGLASYLAIPQLVRIARQKNLFEWKILALCATIEQQRHLRENPELLIQYQEYYSNGLIELKQFIAGNLFGLLDELTIRSALSALAACHGQIKLSKAIIEMSEDVLDQFLERY